MAKCYQEKHRPQFHFSPPAKWMNDPNGMVYYEGEYHLFYQYHPASTIWGPMHWRHAVSKNMVTWEHLPIALYPDSLGYIFSGSAVVDWNNTSGFGENDKPPLIAIYTYHCANGEKNGKSNYQYQAIAYSNDKGRTWKKYEENPVIPNSENIRDFRDPKVIWDDNSNQWIMALATYSHIKFYQSKDLKKWEHLSDWGEEYGAHGGVWECPDLFPITVKNTGEKKWVLIVSLNPGHLFGGSGTQYFIGDFDGVKFILDPDFEKYVTNGNGIWLDHGRDNYAGVTWSDIPNDDGRKLWMGWMSNWDYAQVVPTDIWRGTMTLPREIILNKTNIGYRIYMQPVNELKNIREAKSILNKMELNGELNITPTIGFPPFQSEYILEFEFSKNIGINFGIELSNDLNEIYRLGYNGEKNCFFSDRTQSGNFFFSEKFALKIHQTPRISNKPTLKMHLFFDHSSVELFGDNGEICITDIFFPTRPYDKVKLFAEGGKVILKSMEAYKLKSIW